MDGFFGIGTMELVLVAVIALVVLGPERLPSTLRSIAKFIRQLRNIYNELTSQFSDEFKMLEDINPQKLLRELGDELTGEPPKPEATAKTSATKATSTTKTSVSKPNNTQAVGTKATGANIAENTTKPTATKTDTTKPSTNLVANPVAPNSTTTQQATSVKASSVPDTKSIDTKNIDAKSDTKSDEQAAANKPVANTEVDLDELAEPVAVDAVVAHHANEPSAELRQY